MSTPGRPRLIDADKCVEICELVAAGHSMAAVARAMGCNVKTIRRHAARDEEFRRELLAAEFAARNDPAKLLRRAASSHWRAAAWLLERTNPEKYSRNAAGLCRQPQVEAAFNQLIEAALQGVLNEKRRDLYQQLVKKTQSLSKPLFAPPSERPDKADPLNEFTPLLEIQRAYDEIDESIKSQAA